MLFAQASLRGIVIRKEADKLILARHQFNIVRMMQRMDKANGHLASLKMWEKTVYCAGYYLRSGDIP